MPLSPPPALLDQLAHLDAGALETVLRHVRSRLGVERLKQMTNENTVSVRLPLEVCERVKEIALRYKTTRSRVVRQAVLEFVARAR
jgi:hypothetical protein